MLTEIRIPLRPDGSSAYEKVERRVGDWAVASAGAARGSTAAPSATPGSGLAAVGPNTDRHSRGLRGARGQAATEEIYARGGRDRGAGLQPGDRHARQRGVQAPPRRRADRPPCALRSARCATPRPRKGTDHAGNDDGQRRAGHRRDRGPAAARALPARSARLTGTHWGCDTSNCGTCVVWLDGEPVKSCTVLAAMASGHEVRTVEGLEHDGRARPGAAGLHAVSRAAVRILHARA